MKTVGYTSGIFGKWHLGDEAAYPTDRRGFDEVYIHGGGGIGQIFPGSCGDAPRITREWASRRAGGVGEAGLEDFGDEVFEQHTAQGGPGLKFAKQRIGQIEDGSHKNIFTRKCVRGVKGWERRRPRRLLN